MISLKKLLEHCGHCEEDEITDEAVGGQWGGSTGSRVQRPSQGDTGKVLEALERIARNESNRWKMHADNLVKWQNVSKSKGLIAKDLPIIEKMFTEKGSVDRFAVDYLKVLRKKVNTRQRSGGGIRTYR